MNDDLFCEPSLLLSVTAESIDTFNNTYRLCSMCLLTFIFLLYNYTSVEVQATSLRSILGLTDYFRNCSHVPFLYLRLESELGYGKSYFRIRSPFQI